LWGALTLVLAALLLYTTHRRWTGWATGKAAVRDPAIDGVIAVQVRCPPPTRAVQCWFKAHAFSALRACARGGDRAHSARW